MPKVGEPNVLLLQARKDRNRIQLQLAGVLGVDTQTVWSWERGRRFMSLARRAKHCGFLTRAATTGIVFKERRGEEKRVSPLF